MGLSREKFVLNVCSCFYLLYFISIAIYWLDECSVCQAREVTRAESQFPFSLHQRRKWGMKLQQNFYILWRSLWKFKYRYVYSNVTFARLNLTLKQRTGKVGQKARLKRRMVPLRPWQKQYSVHKENLLKDKQVFRVWWMPLLQSLFKPFICVCSSKYRSLFNNFLKNRRAIIKIGFE